MANILIKSSVGQGGANRPADVAIVQDLLNRQQSTMIQLPLDGLITAELTAAIVKYQKEELKSALPDGRIDAGGRTLSKLLKDATPATAYQLFGQRRSTLGPTARVATVEDLYKRQFGTSPPGLGAIVRAIMADGAVTDIRWAAYMMATIRRGNSRQDAFAIDVGKVSDPRTAYAVLSYGARNGTFTGVSLTNYINMAKCNYVDARRVINGVDHAGEITAAAEAIEVILRVAAL